MPKLFRFGTLLNPQPFAVISQALVQLTFQGVYVSHCIWDPSRRIYGNTIEQLGSTISVVSQIYMTGSTEWEASLSAESLWSALLRGRSGNEVDSIRTIASSIRKVPTKVNVLRLRTSKAESPENALAKPGHSETELWVNFSASVTQKATFIGLSKAKDSIVHPK